jgi:hypothetical protein
MRYPIWATVRIASKNPLVPGFRRMIVAQSCCQSISLRNTVLQDRNRGNSGVAVLLHKRCFAQRNIEISGDEELGVVYFRLATLNFFTSAHSARWYSKSSTARMFMFANPQLLTGRY